MIETIHHQNFYGRFKGRPLGLTKTTLMNNELNKIKIHIQENQRYHPQQFFDDNLKLNKYVLEIGFGGGEHLAEMAQQNPATGFIGCEVFVNGVASLLGHIHNHQLSNIKIHDAIVQSLLPSLKHECLHEIYIMFPDPWPKFRHKKRQLVNPCFLKNLSAVLCPDGFIHMASDDDYYVQSMIDAVSEVKSLKLIDHTNVPITHRALTKYEQKARQQNTVCHYLIVTKAAD